MAGRPDPGSPWIETLLDIWREGQSRSMVGPGDPQRHLDRAVALADALPVPALALDLGSGAGIPGLALAGLWPESRWVLVDAATRRVELLERGIDALGWRDRITVVHGRAEELGREASHREVYDLVTARSFGPPAVTAECGGAFVAVGGDLVVSEPPGAAGERWPAAGLGLLGLEAGERAGGVQRLRRVTRLDPRYPRRVGVPAKRPLF